MDILKNKITAFEAIKKDLKKEIIPTLNLILEDFVSLVNNKKINNFTFRSNNNYKPDQYPIHVSIGYKDLDILIGAMNNDEFTTYMKEIEVRGKKNISSLVKKSLKEINGNLYFLNSNFLKDMPKLVESSYYSLALSNLKQIDLFPEEKVVLFPNFQPHAHESKKTVKIKH